MYKVVLVKVANRLVDCSPDTASDWSNVKSKACLDNVAPVLRRGVDARGELVIKKVNCTTV